MDTDIELYKITGGLHEEAKDIIRRHFCKKSVRDLVSSGNFPVCMHTSMLNCASFGLHKTQISIGYGLIYDKRDLDDLGNEFFLAAVSCCLKRQCHTKFGFYYTEGIDIQPWAPPQKTVTLLLSARRTLGYMRDVEDPAWLYHTITDAEALQMADTWEKWKQIRQDAEDKWQNTLTPEGLIRNAIRDSWVGQSWRTVKKLARLGK